MYNFKEISSVNSRYIFFKDDTRKVVDVKLLHEVIKDIKVELNHYTFMYNKMNEVYDMYTDRINQIQGTINRMNELIESNQDKPIVRRGLSEYHDTLRYNTKSLNENQLLQGGVFSAYDSNHIESLKKLCHQCIKVVNHYERMK